MLAPTLAANATARKRFLREARAAAAISHDHVVTVYAVEENEPAPDSPHAVRGGPPYLVMEFVDGQSLEQKIDRVGHLELKEILRIGRQVAAGLEAAHRQGLIHRDIKPSNILLQNSVERVKITDFGLARAADDVGITHTGEVAGTPQYMSPEQAQGNPIDARSDLFSLGCVLYAMCTGRSPFRAESDDGCSPTRLRRHAATDPRDQSGCARVAGGRHPTAARKGSRRSVPVRGGSLPACWTTAWPTSKIRPPIHSRLRWVPRTPSRRNQICCCGALRRRWAGAAVLIAVLVPVTLSEATGVTNLAATVVRIATGRRHAGDRSRRPDRAGFARRRTTQYHGSRHAGSSRCVRGSTNSRRSRTASR